MPGPASSPGGPPAPVGADRVDAVGAEELLAPRSGRRRTSATVRRTRSGSRREATPPTCGRSAIDAQAAAAEVEAVELHLARGVGERERRRSAVRSSVDLPDCGPPTTSMWPAAPEKSRYSTSRRCSKGLSTRPSGTTSPPGPRVAERGADRGPASARQRRQQLVQRRGPRPAAAATPGAPAGPGPPAGATMTSSTVSASASSSRRAGADQRGSGSGAAYATGTGAAREEHRPPLDGQRPLRAGPRRPCGTCPETYAALKRIISSVPNLR